MAEFAYTTYVRATRDEVWAALTEPATTARYWSGPTFDTGWAPGSPMTWRMAGVAIADPEQVVLEAAAPGRLAYTWHAFTPEWARASGVDEATRAGFAAEPRSRVAFDVEAAGAATRLRVTHSGFGEGSAVLGAVREGWPQVLASLKSLLETGEPLF